jgi:RimJ/RimL family protein N-acetyltransferase
MISLRPLHEADRAAIRSWPPYPGDMEQMDYALRESGWLDECRGKTDTLLYGAEDGNELVAFTILARSSASEAEFRIALRADKTGLGLGEGIMSETLRIGFEEQRLSRIHLIVRKNNIRGLNLYRRLGFTDRGECRREIHGISVDFRLMDISSEEFSRQGKDKAEQQP